MTSSAGCSWPLGNDEVPVTGAAHAALTPFWADRLGRNRFTAFQASRRGGGWSAGARGTGRFCAVREVLEGVLSF